MTAAEITPPPFEFDVAISFCAEDEPLANKLEELLAGRLNTFIYSKKQEMLAGTDGEKTFGEVFGKKARVVVVLFRDKWGTTPWTRIEETAIKNRAFDKGYAFTIWMPTTSTFTLPEYVPKAFLYYSIDHYGFEGSAAVIERRVQEVGGSPRVETLADKAARLQGQIQQEAERKDYLQSGRAVQDAVAAVHALFKELEEKTQSISGWSFDIKRDPNGGRWLDICAGHACLGIWWSQQYSNVLDGSELDVGVWQGLPPRPGRMFFDGPPPRNHSAKYAVDFDVALGELVWVHGKQRVPAFKDGRAPVGRAAGEGAPKRDEEEALDADFTDSRNAGRDCAVGQRGRKS